MRRIVIVVILFCFFLVLILPLIIVRVIAPLVLSQYSKDISVSVYVIEQERLVTMPLEVYVRGVVAAEMLPGFHIEALKAQAVAARTYAVKRMDMFGGKGCSLHPGADVCTDPQHGQAWSSNDTLRVKWGMGGYLRNMYRISQAVRSTEGLVLTYQGKVIDAVYHSSSGGRTASAQEVWGQDVPYLQSVASQFEDASPYNRETKEFLLQDLERQLGVTVTSYGVIQKDKDGRVMNVMTGAQDDFVVVIQRTASERVELLKVGDEIMTGVEIRKLLGLRSSMFSVVCSDDTVAFVTSGYGHGVGMSQYGANGMAEQGYSFDRILMHYYTGIQLAML
jgi:stage II sporulation protein D